MNHKRGRPKNRRAGCLMCKPNKMNSAKGPERATKVKGIKRRITIDKPLTLEEFNELMDEIDPRFDRLIIDRLLELLPDE